MNPDKNIIFATLTPAAKNRKQFYYRLFFLFLLFIIHSSLFIVFAQQPTQQWVQRYTWNSYASGISVKLDTSGNVYVLMYLYSDTTLNDYGLVKYSNSGNLIWSTYYNSPGNLSDNPVAFAVTPNGDTYITGYSGINFTNHITTVKYNANGILQWSKVYNGGPGDEATDITLDKQGFITVFGGSQVNNSLSIALAIKYNSNGDTLWVRKFNQLGLHYSVSYKAAVDDSGNTYSTGSYEPNDSTDYYLTLKYDFNGNLNWYSTYNSPQKLGDVGFCIALDTIRNVYVVGTNGVPSPGNANNTLVKINSSGIVQWASIYKGIGENNLCQFPNDITSTPDGNGIYYITSCQWTGGCDFIILKYSSMGDSSWVRRFVESPNSGIQNNPTALKLDRNLNIYLSGAVQNVTSGYDYVTLKYSPSGTQQWVTTYNGPLSNSDDGANCLVIDTSLNIYVTGMSSRQNNPNFLVDAATIKYSQPIGIIRNNNEVPHEFKLYQNYPNPFNPSTQIVYQLPKRSNINLGLFNILGQKVRTLVDKIQESGNYIINANFNNLASGVYFLRLVANENIIDTKKIILSK